MVAALVGACSESPAPSQPVQRLVEAAGCQSFENAFWDVVNQDLLQGQWPDKERLSSELENLRRTLSEEQRESLDRLFELVLTGLRQEFQLDRPVQALEWTSALEFGDTSTNERLQWYEKLRPMMRELSQGRGSGECGPVAEDYGVADPIPVAQPLTEAQAGLRLTFATAYQSCEALARPPMDASTPDVLGIKSWCCHPDGIGNRRVIEDLPKVLQTHPYVSAATPAPGCGEVRKSPLIYDYGGKPAVTKAGELHLQQNAGDGTSALGIDCSGFVYTALATAGLKLKSNRPLKANGVYAVSSRSFVSFSSGPEPMDCLERAEFTNGEGLTPGMVSAVPGHVFLIDSVGADPFGLRKTRGKNDCASLTFKDFDFVIAQSSNSKNGVGINRYEANVYLGESPKFQTGFHAVARKACESFWDRVSVRPTVANFVLLKHRGTAACKANRIALAGESCARSCPSPQR